MTLLQITLMLSKQLSSFGMYTAKTMSFYEVQKHLLEIVDRNHKTGEAIAEFINETLHSKKNAVNQILIFQLILKNHLSNQRLILSAKSSINPLLNRAKITKRFHN